MRGIQNFSSQPQNNKLLKHSKQGGEALNETVINKPQELRDHQAINGS